MTVLKQYDSGTSQWIPIVSGVPGPTGPTGATGAGGTIAYYGGFHSDQNQAITTALVPQVATFSSSYPTPFGVSVVDGTKLTMAHAGTYTFNFVAQVANLSNDVQEAYFWIRYNGVDWNYSNTQVFLRGRKSAGVPSESLATMTHVGTALNDGDYIELWWYATSAQVSLLYTPATTTPVAPTTPSVIATLTQVTYTQVGPTGATGPQGPEGVSVNIADTLPASPVAGDTWYESDTGKFFVYYDSFWVEVSGTGSIGAQGPIGNTGPTGATGAQGPAATIAVGTTTTGAAGSSASVTNSGTSGAATFDFTIPQGNVGATGTAATITAGTTTTGAAGSSASVTNSGTSSAAVFDFTVPAGATGPTGPEGGTTTLTTKGDILTRGTSALARIGVGSNGTFLKANSSTATGLEWGSIPSVSILDDVGDVVITSATSGQFLKWDGTNWVNATIIGGATVSDSAPSSPTTGQLWYESDSGKTFVYYDSFWVEVGGAAAYDQIIGSVQAKGDILAGTASQAISRLGVGTDTQRLIANSSTSTGLAWANDTTNTVIDAKGDLLVGATADVVAKLPVGTDNQVLVADSTATNGVSWQSRPLNLPWGIIGYATPLSASFTTSSATPVDVTGMSISFTGVANRRYRINFNASQIFGTSGDRARLTFTGTNITPSKSYYFGLLPSISGIADSYSHIFTATGASVIKLQFCRDAGSGNASIYADTAEGYGHFYLEDIGPV